MLHWKKSKKSFFKRAHQISVCFESRPAKGNSVEAGSFLWFMYVLFLSRQRTTFTTFHPVMWNIQPDSCMAHREAALPIEVLWFDTVVTSGNQIYWETDTQIPCLSSNPSYFLFCVKDASPASKSFLTTAYESYTQKLSGKHYEPLKRFIAWIWVLLLGV